MAIRILVVDDATFIRDMVKKHLREKIPGVEVYEAVDGSRALAAMKSQTMDLILSDWEMPNMSGEELLRAVRSSDQGATTPFVMISSRGDRNHVIKAVESGVSDYLTKPFTPEELLRKVFKQLKAVGKAPTHAGRQASTSGDGSMPSTATKRTFGAAGPSDAAIDAGTIPIARLLATSSSRSSQPRGRPPIRGGRP